MTTDTPQPRRRGRPVTGQALTPAERKLAQRQRDAVGDLATMSTDALARTLRKAVTAGNVELLEQCTAEAWRRCQAAAERNT